MDKSTDTDDVGDRDSQEVESYHDNIIYWVFNHIQS